MILAEPLLERVLGEGAEVVERLPGSELVGARYRGPVFELADGGPANAFRVVAGDFVTTEDGTGLVHIAPAFGEDDYAVAAENGIFDPTSHGTLYNPVGLDGKFDHRVAGFEGRFVKDPEVTEALIADLDAPRPALPRAGLRARLPALLALRHAAALLRQVELVRRHLAGARPSCSPTTRQIGWHPEHIKDGPLRQVAGEQRRLGALARPLLGHAAADLGVHGRGLRRALLRRLGRGAARAGQGRGPRRPAPPLHRRGHARLRECGGEMRRVESVIDTWYDSGAMPFAQFHYPFENEELFEERFPADFICEAIDQTRGWFYTLLAESTLLFDTSSYRNCVCLGLILDPEGQKMSKSKGNVVEPWDVISAHGADAFRWYYLTAQQPWSGYRFSVDTVGESVRQFLLTLWNTYSFWVLYANAEDLGPADFAIAASPEPTTEDLDRWALSKLQSTVATVRERMDEFDCTAAGRAIAEYVEELSNWYVRLSRRRFWEGDRAAFATLRHCLLEIAALLAPFTPFLADEIHLNLAGGAGEELGELPDSVHLRDFPEPDPALADPELEAAMEAVRLTVELGRAARAQAKAKVRQPLRRAVIVANDAEREAIEARADLVTAELNVKELDFVSEEADLVSYAVKPNYRSLGPRFGKRMPQVAAAVEALDPVHVAEVMADGGEVGINVDGDEHTIGARRGHARPAAAGGLRGRGRGRPRGRPAARARRRAAPRGPRPRDRPRRPERPQGRRPRHLRPHRAQPSAATTSCSPPPAPTSPTSPARSWPPRSPTTPPRSPRSESTAAICGSRSAAPEGREISSATELSKTIRICAHAKTWRPRYVYGAIMRQAMRERCRRANWTSCRRDRTPRGHRRCRLQCRFRNGRPVNMRAVERAG